MSCVSKTNRMGSPIDPTIQREDGKASERLINCGFMVVSPTGSLTALVCQHSITPLALPCKLILPDRGNLSMHTV